MKLFSVVFLLIFFTLPVFSQASYQIDDYGIYIIDDGGIRKVPVVHEEYMDFHFSFLRGNYAVFAITNAFIDGNLYDNLYFIYDIEKNIVSKYMEYIYTKQNNHIGIQKNKNTVLVNLGGIIYTLDEETLAVKERNIIEEKCDFADCNYRPEASIYQDIEIDENTTRYYFGGGYKHVFWYNYGFLPAELRKNTPFANDYKWVDIKINYDNQLKERVKDKYFKYKIYKYAELHGERFIIIVNYFVLDRK